VKLTDASYAIFSIIIESIYVTGISRNAKAIAEMPFSKLPITVVEIRMKSAAAGKTQFFDPPHMIFAA
jgi:hypothetical protein